MDKIDELSALEREQRADVMHVPLPRRELPARVVVLLWLLRIYVLIAVPLAAYSFFRALAHW